MASVIVAGDTSGSCTLQAPAVSGSSVLTLPVATDTLVGKATTDTLTNKSIAATQLTGTISAARLPTGCVLQVVQSTNTATSNISSSSLVTTSLTGTITPTASSSKILVILNGVFGSSALTNFGYGNLYRTIGSGSPASIGNGFFLGSYISASRSISEFSYQFLDTPSTTSALIYTLYAQCVDGSNIWIGRWGQDVNWTQPTTFTLMEIAV